DELTDKELMHIEADDQAIQTILLGLPEDIYAAVDRCETAQQIWLRVQQMMKGSKIGIQEKKAKLFNEWERFTSNEGPNGKLIHNSIINGPYVRQMIPVPGDPNREVPVNETFHAQTDDKLTAKELKQIEADDQAIQNILLGLLKTSMQPLIVRISSNPRNRQIAQPGMNMGQDRHMQMVGGNGGNQFRQYAGQNVRNLNRLVGVPGNANQNSNGNGNLVVARAEGNATGHNVEQHPANVEETRVLYDSLYNNLAIEVEKVNTVTQKKKLKSDFKIREDELLDKQIQLENKLKEFDDTLVKTGQSIQTSHMLSPKPDSFYHTEQKIALGYQNPFYLKQAQQKHQSLYDGKCYLKIVTQDIMNIVQKQSVVDTSDLQTELEQFQVLNYARENAHLKATYKNLFNSISVSQTQTKTIIDSLQNELQSTIYKNAKLRTQLFKKVSDQKDNTHDTSKNTKFAKQSILGNPPMLDEIHALSKPVTSNSVSTPQEPKVVKNDKVIAPGMFRINPDKTFREEKNVPNIVSASARTKPITVSQTLVCTKKDVNSDLNGLSSTGVDNTKTRRPHPRSNTKHDRVPSASKSSQSKNKEAEVEEHHRNLL
nr:ribonuclease H-like domain-containing protein [Tanacetum cinerariifolium]